MRASILALLLFSNLSATEKLDNEALCQQARAAFLQSLKAPTDSNERLERELFKELRSRNLFETCESNWY